MPPTAKRKPWIWPTPHRITGEFCRTLIRQSRAAANALRIWSDAGHTEHFYLVACERIGELNKTINPDNRTASDLAGFFYSEASGEPWADRAASAAYGIAVATAKLHPFLKGKSRDAEKQVGLLESAAASLDAILPDESAANVRDDRAPGYLGITLDNGRREMGRIGYVDLISFRTRNAHWTLLCGLFENGSKITDHDLLRNPDENTTLEHGTIKRYVSDINKSLVKIGLAIASVRQVGYRLVERKVDTETTEKQPSYPLSKGRLSGQCSRRTQRRGANETNQPAKSRRIKAAN